MAAWNAQILEALQARGIPIEPYPHQPLQGHPSGMAAAKAYPIQGILKYHGLADWRLRIAYLPSISVNNDAAYTLTWVAFDPRLAEDEVIINGERATGRPWERVVASLEAIRQVANISSRARVISKNVTRAGRLGKGLGTSASASAALAAAALAATLGPEIVENRRLLSCMARLLAGSGCRSATGGLSLWLSHEGMSHEESFSVRLDVHNELDDLALLTIPLDSRIGLVTEAAHREAPRSPFYPSWMESRGPEIMECLEALAQRDWRPIGQLAELDSIRLHAITMTASRENKLFAWEPENISLFRLCNALRDEGIPVYFSTDTGPTTVLLTEGHFAERVARAVEGLGLEVVQGRVAGPVTLVPLEEAAQELEST
ncbi:MAG: GHMP kinase [Chloroflexi bacterium]|nr:GHMP kinase [Chloroflexota bacterium]